MTADKQVATVVVIGAGAAGMMAALHAARGGARVILLEKNRKTGVKILMSGGTRCNLTQDTTARRITSAFGHADRFLQPAVGSFDPAALVDQFHRWGVPTKIESTGKIFPASNSAVDVRDALLDAVRQSGVDLRVGQAVVGVEPGGGESPRANRWRVKLDDEQSIDAFVVIVTAGGRSWPKCGTAGDAYPWLESLGHRILRTRPALVPLVGGRPWMHALSGLTLPDVVASVHVADPADKQTRRLARSDVGDGPTKLPKGVLASRRSSWLWTHFGYSGPAAMDVSGIVTAAASPASVQLKLDLAPEEDAATIERALCDGDGRTRLSNRLGQWLPTRLATSMCEHTGGDVSLAQLTAKHRRRVVDQVKGLSLPVAGDRGFAKAEVTAGGVDLSQVDRRTMQSRLHEGLFIAGEVLDVDGPIGGYNFQAAFATGRLAGISAAAVATETV